MTNRVFIATSIDGYIADANNGVDWLHAIPNPENSDMGYAKHMQTIDAIVMGRNTFELVLSFGIEWPYIKPVFVLSQSLNQVPAGYKDKITLLNGEPKEITKQLAKLGYDNLYIDGGVTIQRFLQHDLIDEMVITTIPVVLGDGIPLFGKLPVLKEFRCTYTELFDNGVVQNHYTRHRL